MMYSESFSVQGSFIGMPGGVTPNDANNKEAKEEKRGYGELLNDPVLKVNLIGSCFVWLLSSFNFYLITFYLKSFPGNIFVNSLCFASADMVAFLSSGVISKFYQVGQGLFFSYSISLVGGVLYLIFYSTELPWVIPLLVCISRVGGSMSFNIGYISVARLFPTEYVASVFGLVNFVSHLITVGAPIVAECPEPVPFVVFCINAFLAIFVSTRLKEIDKIDRSTFVDDKAPKQVADKEKGQAVEELDK